MRIAGLVQDSIVDGSGLRFAVYLQGCDLRCEGCHNPDTWDRHGGSEMPVDDVIEKMLGNPLTDGLTLSGGEPFMQAEDCAKLAGKAREHGLGVWVYSGMTFEALAARAKTEPAVKALLELTDVLIDGPFIQAQRTLNLKWRGSRNQRMVDVPKSLKAEKAVEMQ